MEKKLLRLWRAVTIELHYRIQKFQVRWNRRNEIFQKHIKNLKSVASRYVLSLFSHILVQNVEPGINLNSLCSYEQRFPNMYPGF